MPEGTVVLRAFTKDFSAPGLRLGYAVSDAGTAAALRERLQPWPVSCVAEAFGRACMEEPEPFLSRSRRRLARARETLAGELTKRGFRVCPSRANFLLARSPLPGALLAPRLEARRARIRRCGNFEGLDDGWIRFAVKDRESIRRLLPLLDEAMEPDRGSARGGDAPDGPRAARIPGAERAAEPLDPLAETSGTRDT
jgi:threonine-phosphate decarboxylase